MKRFRRYILVVSLICTCWVPASACCEYFDPALYNLFRCTVPLPNARQTRLQESKEFWAGYSGVPQDQLEWSVSHLEARDFDQPYEDPLLKALDAKQEKQAIEFLRLNTRLDRMVQSEHRWDYEKFTEKDYEELVKEIETLQVPKALEKRKTFLKFRCLYAMGRESACQYIWDHVASMWEDCSMRRRIEGYIGGIYFNRHQYDKAIEIYFQQGDGESIQLCVNKMLNLKDIQTEYRKDPDSRILGFILEDYANHFYHSMPFEDDERQTPEDIQKQRQKALKSVIPMKQFALKVVKEGKAKDLKMWATFVGFLQLFSDEAEAAYQTFCQAEKLPGNKVAQSLLRHYKFMASLEGQPVTPEYDRYVAKELKYYAAGRFVTEREKRIIPLLYDYELRRRLSRYVAQKEDAGITQFFVDGMIFPWTHADIDSRMNRKEVEKLRKVLTFKESQDELISHLLPYTKTTVAGVTEILATKLLREGRFDLAAGYFDMVPLKEFNKLGIAKYLAERKCSKVPFTRKDYRYLEDKETVLTTNVKRNFCLRLAKLSSQIENTTGDERCALEYQLADLLFQISPAGDLWAMSEYSLSSWGASMESHLNDMARELLLKILAETRDQSMQVYCHYGLAAIPDNGKVPMHCWDFYSKTYYISVTEAQYQSYLWLKRHKIPGHSVFRTCDWLEMYATTRHL